MLGSLKDHIYSVRKPLRSGGETSLPLPITLSTGLPYRRFAIIRFLKRRSQPKDLLAGLPFALLGLGDTNYDKFW